MAVNLNKINGFFIEDDVVDYNHLAPDLRDAIQTLAALDMSGLISTISLLYADGVNRRETFDPLIMADISNKYITLSHHAKPEQKVIMLSGNWQYTEGKDFQMDLVGPDRIRVNWDIVDTTFNPEIGTEILMLYVTTPEAIGLP